MTQNDLYEELSASFQFLTDVNPAMHQPKSSLPASLTTAGALILHLLAVPLQLYWSLGEQDSQGAVLNSLVPSLTVLVALMNWQLDEGLLLLRFWTI